MDRQGKNGRLALKICGVRNEHAVALCAELGIDFVGFNLCHGSKRWINAATAAKVWRAGTSLRPESRTQAVLVLVDASEAEVAAAARTFPEASVFQCHGTESRADIQRLRDSGSLHGKKIWKAVSVGTSADIVSAHGYAGACDLVLFDAAAAAPGAQVLGGSGKQFNWQWLKAWPQHLPFGLAGGIKPRESFQDPGFRAAWAQLKATKCPMPSLIDVCSGVEASPGVKDPMKVKALWQELASLLTLTVFLGWMSAIEGSKALAQTDVVNRATQTIVGGEEFHRWHRYVRGFRREHNFALSSGLSSGTWEVKRFGTLNGQRFDNSGIYTRFQYSFHLPIYSGFGFFLGSSLGYHYESAERRKIFRPVAAYQFPGVLAGLVININPVLRWSVGFDAYLERHNGVQERDGIGDDPEIHVTMQAYDVGTFFDIFYDLNWALRLEAHRRQVEYIAPKSGDDQTFPVEAKLRKWDEWLGLGLVYHLI